MKLETEYETKVLLMFIIAILLYYSENHGLVIAGHIAIVSSIFYMILSVVECKKRLNKQQRV